MSGTVVLSGIKRSGLSTVVGLLACQADSYLKSFKTTVIACDKIPEKVEAKDSKKKNGAKGDGSPVFSGYELELEDTILFPEGGGQPYDTGYIIANNKEIKVHNVQRDGLTAVHFTEEPIEKGSEVLLKVDWERRLDHMQQHTSQHLLSAILDKRNLETIGWNMGTKFNYIELPRKLTVEEVQEVQKEVNEQIRKAIGIRVERPHHQDVSDHHVPEDYDLEKGAIRVIHIGDLDANPCCGTHLKNTAEIASLVLLHSQANKGTNSRLFFMAGDRVASYAAETNELVRKANAALSCQSDEIEEKIDRLNQLVRELYAKERYWSGKVAKFEADDINSKLKDRKLAIYHNAEANLDFLKTIDKEIGKVEPGSGTVILLCGLGKQGGSIIAYGDKIDDYVAKLKQVVPNVKGGGKGKWQGKVMQWEKGSIEQILNLKLD